MPKSATNHANAARSDEQSRTKFDDYMKELETNKSYARDVNLFKRVSLYRMRGELGTGNFSLVKMAVHELTNEKVAVKVFMKDKLEPAAYDMALAEIANQSQLEHPHVVRLYEAIDTPTRLYMATEFAGGGELFFKVADEGRFLDDTARIVFRQIVDAVAFLHSKLIIHRDLKAENVMFSSATQYWVKLGDFGFSTRVNSRDDKLTTFCGSPPYAAPELYRDDKYDGFLSDIWSLGVLLYFIVTGMLPFRSSNLAELRKLITQGRFRIPEALPGPCKDLLSKILVQTPIQRPSLYAISNCDWLRDVALPSKDVSEHLTDDSYRSECSQRALQVMAELGIDQARLDANQDKSVWSAVNGCLRIVTHRLEKTSSKEPEEHDFPFHLYNLGYEPQRYRVSSGDVVTVANHQHQVAKTQPTGSNEQVDNTSTCLPKSRNRSAKQRGRSRERNRSAKSRSGSTKQSAVCSIL